MPFPASFIHYASVYTRTHAHTDEHNYALSVSNQQFSLVSATCHFHGFLWNLFTSRNSMTSKSQMWKHIFQPLLKESQQSPSPQEMFKKPADPDVCLLLGPSYLHHSFSTLKSAIFHCNRPCKYQWLPHLQTPVLEKLNHLLPHPPGACISAYEGWGKWGIASPYCTSWKQRSTSFSLLLPPTALGPQDTHLTPYIQIWCGMSFCICVAFIG